MSIRLMIMVVCYVIVSGGNCENSDGKYGPARGRVIGGTTPGGPPRELIKQPYNRSSGDVPSKSGRNLNKIFNSTHRVNNSKINNSNNKTILYIDTTTSNSVIPTEEYLNQTKIKGDDDNKTDTFFITPLLPPEFLPKITARQEEINNSTTVTIISNITVLNMTISSLITEEGFNTTEYSSSASAINNVTSPQSLNTTLTNNSTRSSSGGDGSTSSHSHAFNYNYLYFLMIVPVAITIGMGYWVIKKKKPPKRNMTKAEERRMMTPSWVFKEPENEDSSEE